MPQIEYIVSEKTPIAIIIGAGYAPAETTFITEPTATQQLGYIVYPKGHTITPHQHKPQLRQIVGTTEVILVKHGAVEAVLFDNQRKFIAKKLLNSGDIIILLNGGHGFEILEDAVLVEIKQGPYMPNDDKEYFDHDISKCSYH